MGSKSRRPIGLEVRYDPFHDVRFWTTMGPLVESDVADFREDGTIWI